jgi:polar amino acid transport system substrate-binding protein
MEDTMKKNLRLTALLGAIALMLAACGGSGGTDTTTAAAELELVNAGTLTVCTDTPFFPMEYIDESGNYTGFDIELMRAVAGELGLTLTVNEPGWDAITSGLAFDAGECDVAAASITITPERAEVIDFSVPYFVSEQSLLVRDDSGIASIADTAGKEIAVQTGTTGHYYAEDEAPEGTIIVEFPDPDSPWLALESGDVDGVMTDLVATHGWSSNRTGFTIVGIFEPEEYGLATKGAPNLLEAINASLTNLRGDGTYDRIFDDFFGVD